MKVRECSWKVLRLARVVELDGLGQAKKGQQDRNYWTLARVVEWILLGSSNDQLLTVRVSVLYRFFVGFCGFVLRLPNMSWDYIRGLKSVLGWRRGIYKRVKLGFTP